MLRTVYLLLVLVRIYFALLPSYIHPDEHFQGPEIIISEVFGWPAYKTWEFTTSHPIRSIFPLWLFYGPSLTILKWVSQGLGYGEVSPMAIFYTMRSLMFILSFVLEDWALHELLPLPQEQAIGMVFVASSYVTWTYQMHTFSNSIETVIVLWCLVLVRRLRDAGQSTLVRSCSVLAFLGVLGTFNRITFPAWLVVAGVQLLPALLDKPARIMIMLSVAFLTALIAVAMDTKYYSGQQLQLTRIFSTAVITPWNNLAYNLDSSNLAQHGLHPFWLHYLGNLPQLIGPAFPLLFTSSRHDSLFWSGIIGIAALSCFQHQEARFLLPSVPLLLASINLPKRFRREWIYAWVIFNILAAILFGFYHQAGVIPVQVWIEQQPDVSKALWWKTYSPPRWLLGRRNAGIATSDLMGMPAQRMIDQLAVAANCKESTNRTLFIAPSSASFLYDSLALESRDQPITLEYQWHTRQHIGLDDLDFGDHGIRKTFEKVIGRRGLSIYAASKECP